MAIQYLNVAPVSLSIHTGTTGRQQDPQGHTIDTQQTSREEPTDTRPAGGHGQTGGQQDERRRTHCWRTCVQEEGVMLGTWY